MQPSRHISELEEGLSVVRMNDCNAGRNVVFAEAAGDLAAPASQTFVERIFSVCGMLTQGRPNRMCHSH